MLSMVKRLELKETHRACDCLTAQTSQTLFMRFVRGLYVGFVCGFSIRCSERSLLKTTYLGTETLWSQQLSFSQPGDQRGGFLCDLCSRWVGHIWTFWVRSSVSPFTWALLTVSWILCTDSAQQGRARVVMARGPLVSSP